MNNVMINDFRGMIMVSLFLLAILLILKTISIDTVKRIYRIYKWTDIRYRELIFLSGCIMSSTLALGCFDDAQRIVTAGSGFSNWLEIGAMPGNFYHYGILTGFYIMIPVNFGIFLYKMYHTKKGSPNKRIIAEMVLLVIVPLVIIGFHYISRGILHILELFDTNDSYGYKSLLKASLFLSSVIFQIYNTYSIKVSFDFTRLDAIEQEKASNFIWGQDNYRNATEHIQKKHVDWVKWRKIYDRITKFNKKWCK